MADNSVKFLFEYYSTGAKKAREDAKGIAEAQKDFVGATEKAVKISELFKKAVNGVKKASETASGTIQKFTKSLGRILLYRTVRKILSETAQAIKEGTKNLYAYSVALNNTDSTQASKNLDSLATSILYVKNCLGSILAPVIQMITPLVYQMSDAFANASRSIAQVFSALAGNDSFTYAKRFATVFDDSLASASKSAKDIKRTLMGFDEINRLDAPDTSSGSGVSTDLDMSKAFDEGKVSEKAKAIANILKNVVLPVITTIGTALAGVFVGAKITNAVKSFASAFGATEQVALAWGKAFSGVTLIASGIALIVAGVYDVINTGGSLKSWLAILSGIALVVTGVAIAFGGVPALITAIALGVSALGLFVVKNWDTIKAKGLEIFETIKTKINEIWQKILNIPIIGTIAGWLQTIVTAVAKIIAKIVEIQVKIIEISYKVQKTLVSLFFDNAKKNLNELLGACKVAYNGLVTIFKPFATVIAKFFGNNLKVVINSVLTGLCNKVNTFIAMLNVAIGIINKIPNVSISKISYLSVPKLAKGGQVAQGQLFIANEMGAEMVGSMNGKTTVANNQQIVEGIKRGVMEAMQQGGDQNIVLNVDGKQLFDIMVGRNNSIVRTSGRSPLLV